MPWIPNEEAYNKFIKPQVEPEEEVDEETQRYGQEYYEANKEMWEADPDISNWDMHEMVREHVEKMKLQNEIEELSELEA